MTGLGVWKKTELYELKRITQIWSLEFGVWNLAFGVWNLEFWIWDLEFGTWDLEFGIWDLEFGTWNLEFGIWDLEFGPDASGWNFLSTKKCGPKIILNRILIKVKNLYAIFQ